MDTASMSRILFLSQLLPYPPDAGPKIRSYYVLRHLAQKNQITLLAFSRPDDTPEAIQHLQEFCENVHLIPMHRSLIQNLVSMAASIMKGTSFIIQRDYVPEMAQTFDRLLKATPFDAVHTDQLWMAQYALRAKKLSPNTKVVMDEHNACFQIWQRLAAGEHNPIKRLLMEREWRKLKNYEAKACSRFDQLVTVTDEDNLILKNLVASQAPLSNLVFSTPSTKNIITIPICVDTQSSVPVEPNPGSLDVLHLGTMFWAPNVEGVIWFTRKVWPIVIDQIPQATFTIAGKNPPIEIRELSNNGHPSSAIRVTGYIPDPQPLLKKAGVFIVPLLAGGGMRVKIIDAWRWGLPIVSTSIGAEGVHIKPGENILIADDPLTFAQSIVRVLKEASLSERLRLNGRRWVEEHYNWRTVYSKWDVIYSGSSRN
jgi:glycosyltransferase involved in cell wall biosynthesis